MKVFYILWKRCSWCNIVFCYHEITVLQSVLDTALLNKVCWWRPFGKWLPFGWFGCEFDSHWVYSAYSIIIGLHTYSVLLCFWKNMLQCEWLCDRSYKRSGYLSLIMSTHCSLICCYLNGPLVIAYKCPYNHSVSCVLVYKQTVPVSYSKPSPRVD